MTDYVREAFFFRWNLLAFGGSAMAVALTPLGPVLLPLVVAGELAYLTGLVSIPRFRAAIDAKVHAAQSAPLAGAAGGRSPAVALRDALRTSARRAETIRASAFAVRRDAHHRRRRARRVHGPTSAGEEMRTPGLDRLLWLFLRLLVSKTALDRFLQTMNESEINARLDGPAQASFEKAQAGGDERVIRSLQDSIAMAELRLDNFGRAKKNADFVSIELDRIEGKIQTLAEMAVNRQDPDFLSSQVDSAAESMRQTEKAVSELQHLTGLADQLEEPPPIMETDLRGALRDHA